jgi:hypothetical protein
MRRSHAIGVGAALTAIAAGLFVWLAPSRRIKRELPRPQYLSQAARGVLQHRMLRHDDAMEDLTRATLVLDFDGAVEAADRVAAEPMLARPLTGDATELNAALPPRFFELQDQLRSDARSVSAAAARRDGLVLADAFGRLTRTCVSCHALYLRGAE